MQAAAEPDPVERALLLEPLADRSQHRHLAIGPFDPSLAVVGEGDVGDVVALLRGCQGSPFRRDEVGRIGGGGIARGRYGGRGGRSDGRHPDARHPAGGDRDPHQPLVGAGRPARRTSPPRGSRRCSRSRASAALTDEQKARLAARHGDRVTRRRPGLPQPGAQPRAGARAPAREARRGPGRAHESAAPRGRGEPRGSGAWRRSAARRSESEPAGRPRSTSEPRRLVRVGHGGACVPRLPYRPRIAAGGSLPGAADRRSRPAGSRARRGPCPRSAPGRRAALAICAAAARGPGGASASAGSPPTVLGQPATIVGPNTNFFAPGHRRVILGTRHKDVILGTRGADWIVSNGGARRDRRRARQRLHLRRQQPERQEARRPEHADRRDRQRLHRRRLRRRPDRRRPGRPRAQRLRPNRQGPDRRRVRQRPDRRRQLLRPRRRAGAPRTSSAPSTGATR